ncbi:MAG: hypothetical protein COW90_01170 [Nitrospirae bacterium CG22_combo_CG10-13_8_21_14_all_44_11]|nr:MAG: hypothetical protein COW90_01170 [Nitrospirae bacterium CG22_combo_CG10-13_8_21_14_all_44_11]PIW90440.1 MAG: hypothetical protein COZ93_01430 [Nitrospirae bacterium CG_4_8_14_3_um_filter_44_28]PJA82807.1 MAG: hypothetical protein CO147_03705 [Nitrospirae bacterium CG_4_9_14_3_um_filter_44_28]
MNFNKLTVYLFILLLAFVHGFVGFAYGQSGCEQADWDSPLEVDLNVRSSFSNIEKPKHYGTDYRAADGSNVRTVADGTIIEVGFDFKQGINRLGQMGKGWGRYVVIKHVDGSTTLYAHLVTKSTDHLSIGMPITKGAKIGEADSTGGVTGPHLHLEYAPNGKWKHKSSLRDPHPCLVGCPEPPVPLTIAGSEIITRNNTAQYTASGCPSNIIWSVSGSGATISSTGLLTVGSTACGSLTITATCPACGTSATQYVRVTDAGKWGPQTFFYVYDYATYWQHFSDCTTCTFIRGDTSYIWWYCACDLGCPSSCFGSPLPTEPECLHISCKYHVAANTSQWVCP